MQVNKSHNGQATQGHLSLGRVPHLTHRGLMARKLFRKMRLAAELGPLPEKTDNHHKDGEPVFAQPELPGLGKAYFRTLRTQIGKKLGTTGYHVPPYIKRIAGNIKALRREKNRLEALLKSDTAARNYLEKVEATDEKIEEKRKLYLIKILLGEEKI
ncbi:Uncharacterised protein [uncultured archaeon]|nr:Uncharacterised protein [uncultured archaeon]